MAWKLRAAHVFLSTCGKMSVKLAAHVISRSLAVGKLITQILNTAYIHIYLDTRFSVTVYNNFKQKMPWLGVIVTLKVVSMLLVYAFSLLNDTFSHFFSNTFPINSQWFVNSFNLEIFLKTPKTLLASFKRWTTCSTCSIVLAMRSIGRSRFMRKIFHRFLLWVTTNASMNIARYMYCSFAWTK